MSNDTRELTMDDYDQVKVLCETIWEGNDYIPETFPTWISNSLARTIGLFEADELVAIGNFEKIPETKIGWVQGLRVKDGHREKGYATVVAKALIEIAKDFGTQHLWYVTSSRNEGSIKVAERCGFHLADSVGYFRLYKPYPSHPKPSETIVPLKTKPDRLFEILTLRPELVESKTFPLAWHFDFKTQEGLTRLLDDADMWSVVDDTGYVQAIYCHALRDRNEEKTATFTVFSTDRSVFIDIMSRMIDHAESLDADRAVFFLGPRATEWSSGLGYVSDEYTDRRELLFELNPAKK
jgi:GNAT superfamily N-acetyltransferase